MAANVEISPRRTSVFCQLPPRCHDPIVGATKNTFMIVKTISRSEFDQLLPHNPVLEHLMVEQVEWFANTSGNLLGTLAKGKGVSDCNYVILKRDQDGHFQVHKVMNNLLDLKTAKDDLLISMAELAIEQPDLAVPLGHD